MKSAKNNKNNKKNQLTRFDLVEKVLLYLCIFLFALLFISPWVFADLITSGNDSGMQGAGTIQLLAMGMFNLPAVIVSLVSMILGKRQSSKSRVICIALYILSLAVSIFGIIFMATWYIGAASS
ncbi:MAG: hypothetical protein WBK76_03330 [Candidatus Saccharimonadales bacterium]